jgi:hypothetical protein
MNENNTKTSGVKFLALLLVLGGIVGFGIAVLLAPNALALGPLAAVQTFVLFGSVFSCSVWQGINLWRGKPNAIKWAKILFAAQIPAFSFSGIAYEFYTLLSFSLQLGQVQSPTAFNLGSSLSVANVGQGQPNFVGVNVIAIAATAYLFIRFRPNKTLKHDAP